MAMFRGLENPTTKNLLRRLVVLGTFGQLVLLVLLFVPGTPNYWQGWAFMAVNFTVSIVFIAYFYTRDRETLARRMLRKETVRTQKIIMFILRQVAVASYLVCGLDHRFGWSQKYFMPVPWWLTVLALLAYAACYLLFIPVLTANRFAASTIRTETGQTIADTGFYRWVRHPMYTVGIILWFWLPLALGSWVALPAVLVVLLLLAWRLLDEENMLRRELPGYPEYCRRTPWRLVPHVW
jgi:protein-S-isoprenylcysteine O-methyltransferase Ste14